MTLSQRYTLWRNKGKFTPIKLVTLSEIGVDNGYFACQHESHDNYMKYVNEDIPMLGVTKASKLHKQRSDKIMQKYFGPKWIKA